MNQMRKAFEFTFPIPTIGRGKKKNQLVLMNNVSVWYRYYKTPIKNDLKILLGQWYVQKSTIKAQSGEVHFTVIRPNKRRIDADSTSFINKWTVDFLVEQGWFKDDDQVKFVLNPKEITKSPETQLKVEVYIKEEQNDKH